MTSDKGNFQKSEFKGREEPERQNSGTRIRDKESERKDELGIYNPVTRRKDCREGCKENLSTEIYGNTVGSSSALYPGTS